GPDAGQTLQFFDEAKERVRERHDSRESQAASHLRLQSFIPGGSMPPIVFDISSSALRCASLIAATIRSCSISTSSFETTSGSIFTDWICLAPLTTTVTIPPPALPSTRSSVICFCRCSCICCACFIICWMFIISALSCELHLFDVADFGGKDFQHRLHAGVVEPLVAQRRFLVLRLCGRGRRSSL